VATDGFTSDLVAKLLQVGARIRVGEPDAHRGLQEHQVGLCIWLKVFSKLKQKHQHTTTVLLLLQLKLLVLNPSSACLCSRSSCSI
jgi:hypothetical protein